MSAWRKEKVYNQKLFYSPSWNPWTWLCHKHVKDLVSCWVRVISCGKLSCGMEGWVLRETREQGRCVCRRAINDTMLTVSTLCPAFTPTLEGKDDIFKATEGKTCARAFFFRVKHTMLRLVGRSRRSGLCTLAWWYWPCVYCNIYKGLVSRLLSTADMMSVGRSCFQELIRTIEAVCGFCIQL